MLFVMISSILLSAHTAFAAIEPDYYLKKPDQVPYFKSTNSLFPSGAASLEQLKKTVVKTQSSTENAYQWGKIFFAEQELKPLFATHLSNYVISNSGNERLKVLEASTKSLSVLNEATGFTTKVNIRDVHADAYDTGMSIALKDIYLKTKPDDKSETQTTIPQGTRLKVEKFAGQFALVNYQMYRGYIQLSEVMSKVDLASFVFAANQWHKVDHREFDQIITDKNAKIQIDQIKGMITPDNAGLIASSNQKIPLWSHVTLLKATMTQWQQSKIKDQGLVWWRPNKEYEQVYYSIDELLKKDISSVSFHPYNSMKGLVSADGVYITQNGNQWRKLSQFDGYNGPVYYFNDSLIFVGHFRSIDGGKTFENYIQIDKLASAIEYQFGYSPKQMQVQKIESPTPMKIKIEIDTGGRRIKLESPLFTQNWQAIRS